MYCPIVQPFQCFIPFIAAIILICAVIKKHNNIFHYLPRENYQTTSGWSQSFTDTFTEEASITHSPKTATYHQLRRRIAPGNIRCIRVHPAFLQYFFHSIFFTIIRLCPGSSAEISYNLSGVLPAPPAGNATFPFTKISVGHTQRTRALSANNVSKLRPLIFQ